MQIKDILKSKGSKVWTIREDQTIQEALHSLVENKIGCLLVQDKAKKFTGILSERDIVRFLYKQGSNCEVLPVRNVMTKIVIICSPEDTADYAMGIMTQNRIRHIPVMDKLNLAGMISIGDVVKAVHEENKVEIEYLKEYMHGS